MSKVDISTSDRLKLQMEFALPLLLDLGELLGEEVLLNALQQRLDARIAAAAAAGQGPQAPNAEAILSGFEDFGENTLNYEIIASDTDEVRVNVHQCGYAQLAHALGGERYASLLVCGEDYVMTAYAGTELTRTQTRMLGGEYCDFCFNAGAQKSG